MTELRVARSAVLLLVLTCVACGQPSRDSTNLATPVEPGPVAVDPGCGGFFSGPVEAPAAWSTATGACLTGDSAELSSGPKEMYDSCDPSSIFPGACEPLPFGAQFCHNGVWTGLCDDDADCPSGTRCYWGDGVGTKPENVDMGVCERECVASDAADNCLRCDHACDSALGVCLPKATTDPAGAPCTADCECEEREKCLGGHCNGALHLPRQGVCTFGDCPCVGGTCDAQGCCVLPDGTIDPGTGPACNP